MTDIDKLSTNIVRLSDNFDHDQLRIIEKIAIRIAAIKIEKWTGKLSVEVIFNEGGVRDLHVNRYEITRFKKQRGVRK